MKLPVKRLLTLDIETYYGKGYTLKSVGSNALYIRDPRFQILGVGVQDGFGTEPLWFEEHEFRRWALEQDWESIGLIGHNSAFDFFWLGDQLGLHPRFMLDTLSMARALCPPGMPLGLASLGPWLGLGEKGDELRNVEGKRREDLDTEQFRLLGEYCKQDVRLTSEILLRFLQAGFPTRELFHIDWTLRCFTKPTLLGDQEILTKLVKDEAEKKARLMAAVGITDPSTLRSGPKLAELLRSLGVEPPTKLSPTTGQPTYAFAKDDFGMQDLLEHENETVAGLAEARVAVMSGQNQSRAGRFLSLTSRGQRMPIFLKYYGAHTGRWSGGDGTNAQNLERGGLLRDALRAPEGWELVVADSNAIEARGVAWEAGQDDLVRGFATKADIYSEFASLIYNRKVERKRKETRADGTKYNPDEVEGRVGKTNILGNGYGMGWAKAATGLLQKERVQFTQGNADALGVTVEEFLSNPRRAAQFKKLRSRLTVEAFAIHCAVSWKMVDIYRKRYAQIPTLWGVCGQMIQAMYDGDEQAWLPNGCVQTGKEFLRLPNGLKLQYPELRYSDAKIDEETGEEISGGFSFKQGHKRSRIYGGHFLENITQALARIIVADQVLECNQRWGYHIVTTTHDEGVFLVRNGEGERALENVLSVMHTTPAWATGWPLAAEGGVAVRYGDAK